MLTNLFDEVSERGFRVTPRGMAYWAGSGPALKKCRDCAFFSGKAMKKGTCGKFAQMMKKIGPKFGGYVHACKFFKAR